MNLLLITTLLVSGLCSLSSSVPRQFHVVKELKNWTEAQQYCREEFTDLATIGDLIEMEKVKSLINKENSGNVWIGLKNGRSSRWQWSLADRDFYRENESEFRNWGSGQPDGGEQKCVFRNTDGWHDARCNDKYPFICYDGKNSTQLYVLVNEVKNWADAQRYCREHHTDLASVRNQTENNQINEVIGGKRVWIGLFRDAWEWSDGSSSSFRHWNTGQPSYDGGVHDLCVEIFKSNGYWNDAGCQRGRNFICHEGKLVLVRENKTWNDALQYCRDRKMDLVSVRSERIQRWVMERAKGASTDHVWLGLRHACSLGWFWVCGETICYDNWAPGQEQVQECQRVGAVKSGGSWGPEEGQWVSLPETEELNFICTTKEE